MGASSSYVKLDSSASRLLNLVRFTSKRVWNRQKDFVRKYIDRSGHSAFCCFHLHGFRCWKGYLSWRQIHVRKLCLAKNNMNKSLQNITITYSSALMYLSIFQKTFPPCWRVRHVGGGRCIRRHCWSPSCQTSSHILVSGLQIPDRGLRRLLRRSGAFVLDWQGRKYWHI